MASCDDNSNKAVKQFEETEEYKQTGKNIFNCKLCNIATKTYSSKFIVIRHINTVHNNLPRMDRGPPKKMAKRL